MLSPKCTYICYYIHTSPIFTYDVITTYSMSPPIGLRNSEFLRVVYVRGNGPRYPVPVKHVIN